MKIPAIKSSNQFLLLRNSIPLLIAVLIFSCTAPTEKQPSVPTQDELSQMNKDFAKALNAKDSKAVAELYHEDASLLPPNEPIVTGRDNIRNYWQGGIDAGVFDVSVTTLATGGLGDVGYEVGTFRLSFPDSAGKVITETGKFLEILKRGEDGIWKSSYGMWSADSANFTAH